MRGRSGSIRQQALSKADFNAAERHGKRLDVMSQSRRIRDSDPIVYGSLDLADARSAHMENVQQQGKTEALHMLVQYPTGLALGSDPEKKQRAMLLHAVKFANQYHGGDAVFAARLDTDEQGQHTVDIFAMPRYDFTYKDGRTIKRAAVSKFSKKQARNRSADLLDPGENLHPESPIMQGRALQAAWHEYLTTELKMDWVQPPNRKSTKSKDRLEPEEYALKRKLEDLEVREKQIERDAVMVSAARRLERKPVDQEIESIADRARSRRRPAQDQH